MIGRKGWREERTLGRIDASGKWLIIWFTPHQPSPFQNGCSSKNFSSNHPFCLVAGAAFNSVTQQQRRPLSSLLSVSSSMLSGEHWASTKMHHWFESRHIAKYRTIVNENNWKPYTVAVFCCTFYFNLLVNVGHKCRILFTRVCSVCLEVKTTFNRLKVRNWAKRVVVVFLDNSLRCRILREQLAQCTGCYHAFRLRATVQKWWLDH